MARSLVHEPDDPRLAAYRQLKRTNETRDSGVFVVEGEKLVRRLLEGPHPVLSVLSGVRRADQVGAFLPDTIEHLVIPDAWIDDLVGYKFHQAALACARRELGPTLPEFLDGLGVRSLLIVAPRVDNPENLGALIRLADVFGADGLILGKHAPDPFSRRVLRVSMGTALRRPVFLPNDLRGTIADLTGPRGFEAVAAVTDPAAEASERYAEGRPARIALFLGSESSGLESCWISRCSRLVTVRMRAGADSLNLAVAAGILLHDLTRSEF